MKYKTVNVAEVHLSIRVVVVPDDATEEEIVEYASGDISRKCEISKHFLYSPTSTEEDEVLIQNSTEDEISLLKFSADEKTALDEFNSFFGRK